MTKWTQSDKGRLMAFWYKITCCAACTHPISLLFDSIFASNNEVYLTTSLTEKAFWIVIKNSLKVHLEGPRPWYLWRDHESCTHLKSIKTIRICFWGHNSIIMTLTRGIAASLSMVVPWCFWGSIFWCVFFVRLLTLPQKSFTWIVYQ